MLQDVGGQYHYYISNSLTLVHVKTIITTLPGCVTTMVCMLEHCRLAQNAEHRTCVNRTGSEYSINFQKCCMQQTAHAQFPPDFE